MLGIAAISLPSSIDFLTLPSDIATNFFFVRSGIALFLALGLSAAAVLENRAKRWNTRLVEAMFGLNAIAVSLGFLIFLQISPTEQLRSDVSVGFLTAICALHFFTYRFRLIHSVWCFALMVCLIVAKTQLEINTTCPVQAGVTQFVVLNYWANCVARARTAQSPII